MATLSLTIIPSRANIDGSHTIRVVLSHKHRTCYISTPFKVSTAGEWRGGKVVGNPDANIINRKLRNLLNTYQDRIDELPAERLSCYQVRDLITQKAVQKETIKEYIDKIIEQHKTEGKKKTASIVSYSESWLFDFIPEDSPFEILTSKLLEGFEKHLYKHGINNTTAHIILSNIKVCVNSAISEGIASFHIHPFNGFKMPKSNVRDLCLSLEEFRIFRDYTPKAKMQIFAKDLFLLSFYLGGINFADLRDSDLEGDALTFVRKKTARKKQGENKTSITIQPEAREIIDKYGYKRLWREMARHRNTVAITIALRTIGSRLGFEKPLVFYSARKTFVQFGFELDIPLYILEYAIGHSIKDKMNRPIFNYIVIMKEKADKAIRQIIEYTK